MLNNQVNFVLSGSSALGRITMQVGPFSALKGRSGSGEWAIMDSDTEINLDFTFIST